MNKIKILIIFVAIGIFSTSCGDEFLNPVPTSSVVASDFFSSDAELLS